MILLDPDLDPDPALTTTSAKKTVASGSPAPTRNLRLPSARTLTRFLAQAHAAVRLKGQVNVLLTTDAAIRKLNKQFRGKNKATDVLSFPAEGIGAEEIAGDLAVSVPTALKQAIGQGHSLSTEVKVLILHGLLHLAGYDHEADTGQMARRERLLRGRLGLPQGLIERVNAETGGMRISGAKAQIEGKPAFRGLKAPAPSEKDVDVEPSTKTPSKVAALKGHGFSRAAKGEKNATALTAEGRSFAEKAIPQGLNRLLKKGESQAKSLEGISQGLKPGVDLMAVTARLKSCPDTSTKVGETTQPPTRKRGPKP
jgi:probable rRNA maturation factor